MSGMTLKFTSLLIRTVAKPISNTLKAHAKEHQGFRKHCILIAQALHQADVRLRMNLLGEKRVKVRPLNDNKAIDNGANFLSEFFIFSVAGSLIFYESYKSRRKTTEERNNIQDVVSFLQGEVDSLHDEIEVLRTSVKQLAVQEEEVRGTKKTDPKKHAEGEGIEGKQPQTVETRQRTPGRTSDDK